MVLAVLLAAALLVPAASLAVAVDDAGLIETTTELSGAEQAAMLEERPAVQGGTWFLALPQLMPVLLLFIIAVVLARPMGLPPMSPIQHGRYGMGTAPPPALTPRQELERATSEAEHFSIRESAQADYFGRVREAHERERRNRP